MNHSKWIRLPASQLDEQTRVENGVEITVFCSPYDVPRAVRGDYDQDRQRFVIEFKYIQSEPTEKEHLDEHVLARVGRHSGRIILLEIDVDEVEASSVQLNLAVPELVEDALEHPRGAKRQLNTAIARRILEGRPEVFRALDSAR